VGSAVRITAVAAGLSGVALLLLAAGPGATSSMSVVPPAAQTTAGGGNGRTSWYPDQGLDGSLAGVQQAFETAVDGKVFAQPIVADGTLLVVTETNHVYGLDPATGAVRWTREVGAPWPSRDCEDLQPTIGITGAPVVDSTTNTAYFFAKTTGGSNGLYQAHAVDLATGAERPGFPVTIGGPASNDSALDFNAGAELQRPALLLLDGVVYAAFGGICDFGDYHGWIVGVSTAGKIATLWTDSPDGVGGGIWQGGGGLSSDGSGQILVSAGNGPDPEVNASVDSTRNFSESATRLTVQPDGSLRPTDFFAPWNADGLSAADFDLGSSAVTVLPSDTFGTADVPHVGVIGSKQGFLYVLDLDHMGGRGASDDAVLARIGTDGGVFGHAGVWPGDGGYVYIVSGDQLRAYHAETSSGRPTLTPAASTTSGDLGYGSSSPVVTSSGVADGSAIVWVVAMHHPNDPDAQLRGYAAVPTGSELTLRYSIPVPNATKLSEPAVADGLLYVAAAGKVYAIEPSGSSGLVGQPVTITSYGGAVGGAAEVLAATRDVQLQGVRVAGPGFRLVGAPKAPVALQAGERLTLQLGYASQSSQTGELSLRTEAGTTTIALLGTAVATSSPAVDPNLRWGYRGPHRAVAM
jgi:outer membrane protein assembly factor BamB